MKGRRIIALGFVVVLALAAGVGLRSATAGEPTQRHGVLHADEAAITLPSTDSAQTDLNGVDNADLHGDLDRLADAWAVGGGEQGYPYFDQAMREWRAGRMSDSALMAYLDSYRQLLTKGLDLVDSADEKTRPAEAVRDVLIRALHDRIDATALLGRCLNAKLIHEEELDGLPVDVLQARALDGLDQSYRETRLAMNSAQLLLDAAGQRRIPEDAFL